MDPLSPINNGHNQEHLDLDVDNGGKIWGREPVMILAVVQAAIALVIAFGFELSPEQVGAIVAFFAAVLGLVARTQVTPT